MALFGFVFYRQNHRFTSVKSGDSCIFKMGSFRNFMFFALRPSTRIPWCLKFLWLLELGRLVLFHGGRPQGPSDSCFHNFFKFKGPTKPNEARRALILNILHRRIFGIFRPTSLPCRAEAMPRTMAVFRAADQPPHIASTSRPAPVSSFLILTSSFISPPSSHPRLDIGCPTPKIILRHSFAPLRVLGMRPFPRWPVEARHSPHSSFVHSSSFTQA